MAASRRRVNPQERIEELREKLQAEQELRESAEDEAFNLRGRLARIEGLASIEEEDDEDVDDEEEDDEDVDDEEEDDEEDDDEEEDDDDD
jgi:hypothetical protein